MIPSDRDLLYGQTLSKDVAAARRIRRLSATSGRGAEQFFRRRIEARAAVSVMSDCARPCAGGDTWSLAIITGFGPVPGSQPAADNAANVLAETIGSSSVCFC